MGRLSKNYECALKIKESEKELPYPPIDLKIKLFPFQVRGVYCAFAAERYLIGDATGLGKSAQCMGVIDLVDKKTDEDKRWVIVCPACATRQWGSEIEKFLGEKPVLLTGEWEERKHVYISQQFRILVVSYNILIRDWRMLDELHIKNWVFDDAHVFKNKSTKTFERVKFLASSARRVLLTSATPLQKSPTDFHSLLEVLGVTNTTVGSETAYLNRYVKWHWQAIRVRRGKEVHVRKIDSWIEGRQAELKELTKPFYIKRTYDDVGMEIPSLTVCPVYLDLLPDQRKLYQQSKKDTLVVWDNGERSLVKNNGFHSMMKSLDSVRLLDETKSDTSVKYDMVEMLVGNILQDATEDKIIIFSFYVNTVKYLSERLEKMGLVRSDTIKEDDMDTVGYTTIKGEDSGDDKEKARREFQENPKCRVLIGTTTIEQAINLQKARHLIMVDLLFNPQRIVQLVGRMRRIGSIHQVCYLHVLLAQGTIEETLWKRNHYEARLTDKFFDEKSDVFVEPTVEELIKMIREEG